MAIQGGISHPSALFHPSPLIDNEATQVKLVKYHFLDDSHLFRDRYLCLVQKDTKEPVGGGK